MSRHHLPLLLLLALLLSGSCRGDYLESDAPELVVEGWIDRGGYPVVIVGLSMPVTEEPREFADLESYILRWARVSISDGTDTLVMMGRYSREFFPPFIYTTYDMQGEEGKTYTIEVKYRHLSARATTSIPRRVVPDSITLRPISASSDATMRRPFEAVVSLTDPPSTTDYYATMVRVGEGSAHFLPAHLGTLSDTYLSGLVEMAVYRPHSIVLPQYDRYFREGEDIVVKFATIDATSYRVLTDFTQSQAMTNNVLMPSSRNLYSNVVGGQGYWIGCNATFRRFVVGAPDE